MIIILTGFAAGLLHVLTGPDHMAAIAPLSIEGRKSTWKIGFKWGLGHTGGVLIIGMLALLFRELIPMKLISSYSERLVGIVLIGIGLWGLKKVLSQKIHTHEHTHDGKQHIHIHAHGITTEHNKPEAHVHIHAAFGVGIIHGLAGSSHLLGVLPALALPTGTEAAIYLLFFGIGTITAMAVFSTTVGLIASRVSDFGLRFYKTMLISFSTIAIGIGCVWLFL
ncbi:MAG: urease accessory protein UreH domain-containing protein [Ignavibacteriaceae bacterium]